MNFAVVNIDSEKTPRSCKKLIRFTPSELARVNERAQAAGQPVACYIRDASVGVKRKTSSASFSGPIIHSLARVAMRLQSLRDTAEAKSLPEAGDFGDAVEDLLTLINRIE